jgi:hypothetical protein
MYSIIKWTRGLLKDVANIEGNRVHIYAYEDYHVYGYPLYGYLL